MLHHEATRATTHREAGTNRRHARNDVCGETGTVADYMLIIYRHLEQISSK